MTSKIVTGIIAVLIGLLLTWGTSMFPTPFARIQIDMVGYGAPLAYSTRIIPTEIITLNWTNLVLDVAFWAIIVYLILTVILRTSPKKKIEETL